MTRTLLAASALVLVAACSQEGATPGIGDASPTETATAAVDASPSPIASSAPASPDVDAQGRQHVYSSLERCAVIREEHDEMPYREVECAGAGGFDIRIADSDARQAMTLVDPGGTAHRLSTARVGGGGFSSFGKTAEWRGKDVSAAGGHFEPDSLIVRYDVAERPSPAPETSWLLVVRLTPRPCIVAKVPPGSDQNRTARDAADDPGVCRTN